MPRLAAVLLTLLAVEAGATGEPDVASAIALFNEGRRLMGDGRIAEACERFAVAQKLGPGVGIQLNLADCWARLGRTASAWGAFRQAAALAAEGDPRGPYALERAAALEGRVPRLTVVAAGEPGLVVHRDGVAIELGIPVTLDPGEHQLEADAPGKVPWSRRLTVAEGAAVTVEIPPLTAPPTVAVAAPREPPHEPPREPPRRRWIAVAVGGAGVLALGTSAMLVLVAQAQYDDAVARHCGAMLACDGPGLDAIHAARVKGTAATLVGAAGVAALGAGALLWIAAPRARLVAAPVVTPSAVGLAFGGTL